MEAMNGQSKAETEKQAARVQRGCFEIGGKVQGQMQAGWGNISACMWRWQGRFRCLRARAKNGLKIGHHPTPRNRLRPG
jgi:hypothetical protein